MLYVCAVSISWKSKWTCVNIYATIEVSLELNVRLTFIKIKIIELIYNAWAVIHQQLHYIQTPSEMCTFFNK